MSQIDHATTFQMQLNAQIAELMHEQQKEIVANAFKAAFQDKDKTLADVRSMLELPDVQQYLSEIPVAAVVAGGTTARATRKTRRQNAPAKAKTRKKKTTKAKRVRRSKAEVEVEIQKAGAAIMAALVKSEEPLGKAAILKTCRRNRAQVEANWNAAIKALEADKSIKSKGEKRLKVYSSNLKTSKAVSKTVK